MSRGAGTLALDSPRGRTYAFGKRFLIGKPPRRFARFLHGKCDIDRYRVISTDTD